MSLSASENMVMPVAPMYGGGYGGNTGSFGWGGDGSFWIIILFLFAMFNGGWGNGFGNGGGMNGMFPYMMNNTTNNDMQRGFDQQAIMGGLNGIQGSLAQAEVSRCNGVNGITTAMNAGFTGLSNGINAGFTGVQTALANNQMGLYQMYNNNQSDLMQAMNNANMTQMQNANMLANSLQQCLTTVGTLAA